MDVGEEQRSPSGTGGNNLCPTGSVDDAIGEAGNDNDQYGQRDDPASPAAVEGQDARSACRNALSKEDAGDDEPGDDKEDIDTDITCGQMRDTDVIGEHE
jgi:hypothetical protein